MENMVELTKDKIGSIYRCRHGIIHIHIQGISLHFTEEAFFNFTSIVKEGASKLMDIKLAKLTGDS